MTRTEDRSGLEILFDIIMFVARKIYWRLWHAKHFVACLFPTLVWRGIIIRANENRQPCNDIVIRGMNITIRDDNPAINIENDEIIIQTYPSSLSSKERRALRKRLLRKGRFTGAWKALEHEFA